MGLASSDQINGWNVSHKLQKRKLLIAINCVAATSIFFFGYDQGVMSGVNNAKDYLETMGIGYVEKDGTPVITNAVRQGGIISVYYLGTLFGALLGGWGGEKIGRVRMIAAGAAWSFLGVSLQCSAHSHQWMICARVINGFGTGILNAIVPVWATETAQHTSRGRFVSIQFSVNIFGIFAAYWLEYGLSFVEGGVTSLRWRFPIAFQILPLLTLFATVWMFPESPRWLTKVGREEEAMYVLKRLRGDGRDPVDQGKAALEFQDIRNVADLEKSTMHSSSYLAMLTGRANGKLHTGRRVCLVILLQIMQKWVGITGVVIYQPTIFRLAGYSSPKSQLLSGVNTITYMVSTLICVFTLDRIGRRWSLWWGSTAQGITMFLLGCFIRLSIDAKNADEVHKQALYGAGAACMVYIFTFVFGATWLTVPWAYQAEIFPLAVRSKGNAWGVVGWSIGSGWMVLLVPLMFENLGEKTFYIFGAGNMLTIPIVWAFYPESNQRTLEEMDLLFAAETPWAWDAERNYKKLAEENPHILQATRRVKMVHNRETGLLTTGTASTLVSVTGTEKRISTITGSLPDASGSEKGISMIIKSQPEDHRTRVGWVFDPRYTSFLWDDDEHFEHMKDVPDQKESNRGTQRRCNCSQRADRVSRKGPSWPITTCCGQCMKVLKGNEPTGHPSWPITACYDQCSRPPITDQSVIIPPRPRRLTVGIPPPPPPPPPPSIPRGSETRHLHHRPLHTRFPLPPQSHPPPPPPKRHSSSLGGLPF